MSAAFHWAQHAETVEMLHATDGVPERRVAERGCERISGSGYLGSCIRGFARRNRDVQEPPKVVGAGCHDVKQTTPTHVRDGHRAMPACDPFNFSTLLRRFRYAAGLSQE